MTSWQHEGLISNSAITPVHPRIIQKVQRSSQRPYFSLQPLTIFNFNLGTSTACTHWHFPTSGARTSPTKVLSMAHPQAIKNNSSSPRQQYRIVFLVTANIYYAFVFVFHFCPHQRAFGRIPQDKKLQLTIRMDVVVCSHSKVMTNIFNSFNFSAGFRMPLIFHSANTSYALFIHKHAQEGLQ